MRGLDLQRLSPEHQNFVRERMRKAASQKKPRTPEHLAFGVEFDSGLEVRFAGRLEGLRCANDIAEWYYHPMRFRLAPGLTYEPDFGAAVSSSQPHESITRHYDFIIYEVKGSWKSKNARDSRTRLKVAASMFPCFEWYGVTPGELSAWDFERMSA